MDCPDWDVCIVGGGPAGATAAFRLAVWGHRVCVVEQAQYPRPHVGESLSPGALPLLKSLGLADIAARAGQPAPDETLICWAHPQVEPVSRARAASFLVDRARFDALLLQAAELAGAKIFQPARAVPEPCSSGWRIRAAGSTPVTFTAGLLIDAAGRRGCIPGRRVPFSPPMRALWSRLPGRDGEPVRLEAIPSGWIWSAPIGSDAISLLFFSSGPGFRRTGLSCEDFLRKTLAGTQLFAGWAQAPLLGPIAQLDATCIHAAEPAGPSYLKIGEASFSLDPLSSTGVEKAIQTAMIGACIVHTMRHYPERTALGARFHRERQQEAVALNTAWNRRFYAEVERFADEPFWNSRRAYGVISPGSAFTAPALSCGRGLRLSADVSVQEEPCLVGDFIEGRLGLRSPRLNRPLVFLGGVEVATLLEGLNDAPTRETLLRRWSATLPRIQAERLCRWLWERQILVYAD